MFYRIQALWSLYTDISYPFSQQSWDYEPTISSISLIEISDIKLLTQDYSAGNWNEPGFPIASLRASVVPQFIRTKVLKKRSIRDG